ncbi:MAG: pyridoxamine 5'-phosphate oxidase family protein [Roseiflexaceae bacterium]
MLPLLHIPAPTPARKVTGYQMPEESARLLGWEFVVAQAEAARHYWLSSVFADGRPHAVPLWGLWYQNRVHFEGSPQTAWVRNLQQDPRCVLHLPSGDQVVIIEGSAHMIADDQLSAEEWLDLDTRFQHKYQVQHGSPYWYLQPHKILAWNGEDLQTMTRWVFRDS